MYINKKLYLTLKAVAVVGMYLWGSLVVRFIEILLFDLFAGFTDDVFLRINS